MKTQNRMQNAEGRRQNLASRITHHASPPAPHAFTLIELLVVISMIAILAALTFPAIGAAKVSIMRKRAQAELKFVEAAIEAYHDKLGYYPPDNTNDWSASQLYYELLGTTNVTIGGAPYYQTRDGSSQIRVADVPAAFKNPALTSFLNCSRGGEDGLPGAVSFLTGLKSAQYMAVTLTNPPPPGPAPITVLGTSLDGPPNGFFTSATGAKLNPWRYNSSSPHNNPKTYDLWIDVMAGSKTNRICNWNNNYLIIGNPQPAYP
jgi:prepilin-type N-terminal cleavage/methylation domain-containing protein